MGIMEKKTDNYQDYRGYTGVTQGIMRYMLGLYGDNGKENGNHSNNGVYIGVISHGF